MNPITDMITIIKNGLAVKKDQVKMPYSNLRHASLKVLKKHGYIAGAKKTSKDKKDYLVVDLAYDEAGQPVIKKITPVSKSGRRIYSTYSELKPYKPKAGWGEGLGITVISTSKGLLTAKEARNKKVGGEVLFKVY